MTEHLKFLEEAEKRNHLRIGKEQELFFFDEVSPVWPGRLHFTSCRSRLTCC